MGVERSGYTTQSDLRGGIMCFCRRGGIFRKIKKEQPIICTGKLSGKGPGGYVIKVFSQSCKVRKYMQVVSINESTASWEGSVIGFFDD